MAETQFLPTLNPLEMMAVTTVDKAYSDNKIGWKDTHEKFRRLYNFVRQNEPASLKTNEDDRSQLRVGLPWMITEIIHATIVNALLRQSPIGELVDIADNPYPFSADMERLMEIQLTDEHMDVTDKISLAILDAIMLGPGILAVNWRRVIKRVFQEFPPGQSLSQGNVGSMFTQELEKVVYAGPDYDVIAPWNVFPTKGITSFDNAHEIIIRIENMPLHQMREFEHEGVFTQGSVDQFVGMLGSRQQDQDLLSSLSPISQREKTEPEAEGTHDVIVYYGLFPLNNFQRYIDDDGRDRSKDEVECIIIKPINAPVIFKIDRNPYFNQMKPVIVGGYAQISGEPWPIGPIEIAEDLLIHYNNWLNILQDGANLVVHPDEIVPREAIDEGEGEQAGPTQRYHTSADNIAKGAHFKRLWPTGSILSTGAYEQLNIVKGLIEEIIGVVDLVRGVSQRKRTATEVEEISERVNIRFKERILNIENTILRPSLNWLLSLNAQYHMDLDWMMSIIGNLSFNPFAYIDPVMPNNTTRWKLTGAIRASDNAVNARKIEHLLALASTIPPGPDGNGEMKAVSLMALLEDLIKQSNLPDSDKYLIPPEQLPPPELAPSLQGASAPQNRQGGTAQGKIMGNINQEPGVPRRRF